MSLLILATDDMAGEIGVFCGDMLVGSGVLSSGRCGVAVRGDDPSTPEIDGAVAGMPLEFRHFSGEGSSDLNDYKLLTGTENYQSDSFTVLQLTAPTLPLEVAICTAYPNPFNSMVTVAYSIPEASDVEIAIHDLSGRLVAKGDYANIASGLHEYIWQADRMPSGLYFCRIGWHNQERCAKLMLVK
jgi:hypothetical protein